MTQIEAVSDDTAPVKGIVIAVVTSAIFWILVGEIGLAILK